LYNNQDIEKAFEREEESEMTYINHYKGIKKVIYDRVDDADVKVTATGQIAQMYIRKQRIFTEKKVYRFSCLSHRRPASQGEC
jgi:hypothetical protein